jgi:hypothetical protein
LATFFCRSLFFSGLVVRAYPSRHRPYILTLSLYWIFFGKRRDHYSGIVHTPSLSFVKGLDKTFTSYYSGKREGGDYSGIIPTGPYSGIKDAEKGVAVFPPRDIG